MFKRMIGDESGAALVEYGLLVSLISFAALAGMAAVGTDFTTLFTNIGTKISNAVAPLIG